MQRMNFPKGINKGNIIIIFEKGSSLFIHSLTHFSLYSVYCIVNYIGNDEMRFQTLRWNFLNIIASVDAPDICLMQAGVPSIM